MSDVVLVHGSTQSAAGFWRLTKALSRRGHRTLTMEVPSAAADTQHRIGVSLVTRMFCQVRW
jgi:hypothetical protein